MGSEEMQIATHRAGENEEMTNTLCTVFEFFVLFGFFGGEIRGSKVSLKETLPNLCLPRKVVILYRS